MSSHLDQNRPIILGRAAFASALGLLPIPVLDELLAGAVRTTLLRRIADIRQVDATDSALSILAYSAPPTSGALSTLGTLSRGAGTLRRSLRRIFAVIRIAGRADEAATTFAVATLFDHYCARHHIGSGVDEPLSRRIRTAIEAAIGDARGQLARRGLDRAGRGATAFLRSGPRLVANLVRRIPLPSRRTLHTLTGSPDPNAGPNQGPSSSALQAPEQPELIDPASLMVARRGLDPRGLVERSTFAVADLLGNTGRSWVEELTRAFDARWARAAR